MSLVSLVTLVSWQRALPTRPTTKQKTTRKTGKIRPNTRPGHQRRQGRGAANNNSSVQEGGAPKQHTHYGGEGRALHRAEVLPAKYVVLASACFGFLLVACIFSRFVGVLVLVFSVLVQIAFFCLCSCKDQAIVRHRPHSRKKKNGFWFWCRVHQSGTRG